MRSIFKIVVLGGIAAVIWRIQKVLMTRADRDDEPASPYGTGLVFGDEVELRASDELDYEDLERLYEVEAVPPTDADERSVGDFGVA